MDKDKIKKEIKKIFAQKQLKNLMAVCLVLAFILLAMNVFLPSNKSLTSNKITGIITGKLNMAIKVPLLPAFEAMADIMVNTIEKLTLPNNTVKK